MLHVDHSKHHGKAHKAHGPEDERTLLFQDGAQSIRE